MNILLGTSSKTALEELLSQPSHAIGIFAEKGSGKGYVAINFASQLIGIQPSINSAELHIVRPNDKGSITIDDIRIVTNFLKLKAGRSDRISRAVIIEDAGCMTTEAQNALLKTLEEPPKDSILILTAESPSALLPTITSRLKAVQLKPANKAAVTKHFGDKYSPADVERAWSISGGRLGLMSSLLEDKDHPLLPYLEMAKGIITSSRFDRLNMVDSLSKQNLRGVFDGLMIVSTAAFRGAVNKGDLNQIKRWHHIRSTIYNYSQTLSFNPNNKLLLTDLMLQL